MLKIANFTDLHLNDKNIGSSVGYPQQSLANIDLMQKFCEENEIDVAILGGDIGHKQLTRLKFISEVLTKMTKLRDSLNGNLFAIPGNHDYSSKDGFTLFDLLVSQNIVIYTKKITLNKVCIHMFPYAYYEHELVCNDTEDYKVNIGIYHNNLLEPNLVSEHIGITIDPETAGLFEGMDILIVNHIHSAHGIRRIRIGDKYAQIITPGSIGLTSYSECNRRTKVDIPILKVIDDEEGVVEIDCAPFPLPDLDKLYDAGKILAVKQKQNAFQQFSDRLKDININFLNASEEIVKKDLDPKLKEKCLHLLGKL